MHLEPDGAAGCQQIIPFLRKQKGLLDGITFLHPSGKKVHAFSLWETAEDAEGYKRGADPAVTKLLASVIEGASRAQTC
jgi:hypothetical protein